MKLEKHNINFSIANCLNFVVQKYKMFFRLNLRFFAPYPPSVIDQVASEINIVDMEYVTLDPAKHG